jgi:hypothetical protein
MVPFIWTLSLGQSGNHVRTSEIDIRDKFNKLAPVQTFTENFGESIPPVMLAEDLDVVLLIERVKAPPRPIEAPTQPWMELMLGVLKLKSGSLHFMSMWKGKIEDTYTYRLFVCVPASPIDASPLNEIFTGKVLYNIRETTVELKKDSLCKDAAYTSMVASAVRSASTPIYLFPPIVQPVSCFDKSANLSSRVVMICIL